MRLIESLRSLWHESKRWNPNYLGHTCETDEGETRLLCICEGIICRACKTNLIRRPISDHFKESDGRIWHTPYFMGMFPCSECRKEKP